MNLELVKLGMSNVRNKVAESLYLKLNVDITRPIQIYGIVNNRCNAKCRMCDSWRYEELSELPASVWIRALTSLNSFVGTFHINFSGGEPLLKRDFIDILEYCDKARIMAGFTTNGLLLGQKNVQRIINLKLFNINISLDSMEDNIHDEIRGFPGMLSKVKENIKYLIAQKQISGSVFQIILKPIVCSRNLNCLDKIVEYAKDMNLTGVNFQPVFKWSKESEEMFKVDKENLDVMIEKLIGMKKRGYDILNSEASIRQWKLHFDEIIPGRNSLCVVPLRNLTIKPNGDVFMCGFRDLKIGNIGNDDMEKMWHSEETRKLRKVLVNCNKLCTATCVVKLSWKDYIELLFKLVKK